MFNNNLTCLFAVQALQGKEAADRPQERSFPDHPRRAHHPLPRPPHQGARHHPPRHRHLQNHGLHQV